MKIPRVDVLVVPVLAALLTACATPPENPRARHNVGLSRIVVPDARDKPIEMGVWYPTDAAPKPVDLGLTRQSVAVDAPVAGKALPLVVISHGNGGGFTSHADTAAALAAAGFVVAAPTHTGDNFRDDSYVGTARWLTERPRHMERVIEYMRSGWPEHTRLDGRVGVFGFSAGAFTALVLIGGEPDLTRVAQHCRAAPELACSLFKGLPTATPPRDAWVHDARISAAVVAAPGLGFSFEPSGLAHLTAPVQLWAGGDDRIVLAASNTALVRAQLPQSTEYHEVPGAGHMSFLTPCPGGPPTLCRDAEGFDRASFHARFNEEVISFFRENLQAR